MPMKKLLILGLSTLIAANILIPVNAYAFGSQDVKAGLACVRSEVDKEALGQVKSITANCEQAQTHRYINRKEAVERLKRYLERVEYAYKRGWISESKYKRLKAYITRTIERLEPNPGKPDPCPDPCPKPDPKPDPGPDPKPDPKPDPQPNPPTGISAAEQQMVNLVNEARRRNGVKPLIVDAKLSQVARIKSKDMVDNNYFSHHSPTYGSPFDMLKRFGISYRRAGENIAGNQTVERAHQSLMNSPGHRQNILSPHYTHVGIGIQQGGRYGAMFTQLFIQK